MNRSAKKRMGALLAGLAAFGCCFSEAAASNLDTYRRLLMERTYTIRYENVTPPPRVTNRDKTPLYGSAGISGDSAVMTNRQRAGVIVANGNDRYEEIYGVYPGSEKRTLVSCHLQKGGESFFYSKWKDEDAWVYYGSGKNAVKAVKSNALGRLVNGESFGDADISRLLLAILPDSRRSADMPRYVYVRSGWLDNGLNYEDYQAEDGSLNVIRYYFDSYTLVKIAAASYAERPDGHVDAQRSILLIKEFSPTPDASLLRLPDGVADKTKRANKEESEA